VETKPLFIDDSSSLLNPKAGNLGGGVCFVCSGDYPTVDSGGTIKALCMSSEGYPSVPDPKIQ
jgi:hypothetical protein